MKIMVKKYITKIFIIACVFFMINMFCSNQILFAEDDPYTYEDYLEEKREEEEEKRFEEYKQEKKRKESVKDMQLTLLFFCGVGIVGFIWYKIRKSYLRDLMEQKEKDQLAEALRKKKMMEEIQKKYSHFTEEEFKKFILKMLILLQKTIENKDLVKLRKIESEALFATHKKIIEELGIQKLCTDSQDLKDIQLEAFLTGAYDTIIVSMKVHLVEYYFDQTSLTIVKGFKDKKVARYYRMGFTRKAIQEELLYKNCPNCGAPIELDERGRCSYCHSSLQETIDPWKIDTYEELERYDYKGD